jgi:hypothetical protein
MKNIPINYHKLPGIEALILGLAGNRDAPAHWRGGGTSASKSCDGRQFCYAEAGTSTILEGRPKVESGLTLLKKS